MKDSFVSETKHADFVALCSIAKKTHGIFLLTVLEVIKGIEETRMIEVFANSECNENLEEIKGELFDTVLVAVYKKNHNDTCKIFNYEFVYKYSNISYMTSLCGNNSVLVKGDTVIGSITKPYGYVNGIKKDNYIRYKEERMHYQTVKQLIK